ncbi:hypothetical protein F8388_024386 [Cannabis sativa]|uniref:K Homology domain-containing protein n=1 Tax=Cannabis sativa TaxID=3483 RepID=A0A7J6DSP6_CANSA|nr:hypothetical protein F8388_024386 [Cannabis sativa]
MASSLSTGGRYMAYSPSPSSPHLLSALRSASSTSASLIVDQEKYLAELLAERLKLTPFVAVLPHCFRLLNQVVLKSLLTYFSLGFNAQGDLCICGTSDPEAATKCLKIIKGQAVEQTYLAVKDGYDDRKSINSSNAHSVTLFFNLLTWRKYRVVYPLTANFLTNADWYILFLEIDIFGAEILRVTTLLGNASVLGQSGLEHASPLASGGMYSNGGADVNVWSSRFQSEMSSLLQPASSPNWLSSQSSSSGLIVKRTIRVDIPVEHYPNYNFVGRLLGPRGNSLKRVEATTDCRVLIRGRGSIKDPTREEMMRGKPGYEHLNEPLHILVEAELPVEIIDARLMQAREILEDLLRPMDESQDFYKKQQLRELAMLNGTLREEGSPMSGSVSPFQNNSLGMKRAKTRG